MTAVAVPGLASSSLGCDAPPPAGESSMKFTKVEKIPPRKEKVIVKMARKASNILKTNVLSDEEPDTIELKGSKLKEWSQEEKEVFSEMITAFGMNFPKVSNFLRHKTAADCKQYYFEHYKSECHKEAQKSLPTTVMQSQENCCNENDAARLVSGIAAVTDKGHGESSMDEHEHVTGEVLVGESNAAPSPLRMRSSQATSLTIRKTDVPVLENFNEDSCFNEAVCITKSCPMVKENIPQSVLISNNGDEGNCGVAGSCGEDTLKIMSLPDKSCAKLANGTIKGDKVRSGGKNPDLCSSMKECNDGTKHLSLKATEKKVTNSNIDDGRMAPSVMENPNSKYSPCNTSDPAAMLTGPAFVQHMMEFDEAMEKKELEKNDVKVKGKEGNNPIFYVASKHGSGIQLSCEVNSQEIENVDSIPSPEGNGNSIPSREGNGHNADMENPTKDSSPCVATNAAVVKDDIIQRLRASHAMYTYSGGNEDNVKSMEGNPTHSVDSKECNGIQLSYSMTSRKGKGILSCPDGNNYYAPPVYISNEASKTYRLPSSSSCAALDIVHATSSYSAMDIDLNIPLDVTPLDVTSVDLGNSNAAAFMGRCSEAADSDSDATMEIISGSQTTTAVPQTSQQQPANQPGSLMLFGQVIYQAPSTGTTNHTPNQQVNQIVVPVTRRSGQAYPSWATTSSVPNNQLGQQAVLSNWMPYGGSSSTNGASASAASPLQLQPEITALANIIYQQRQQALVNITPNIILGGGLPIMPSHLIQGSSGGAGLLNLNGAFNYSAQWPWTYPVVDTSRLVIGHPFFYPGANANQEPATALTIASIGINNGEGASRSNARAPPGGGRGRGRNSTWLSLHRNNQQ